MQPVRSESVVISRSIAQTKHNSFTQTTSTLLTGSVCLRRELFRGKNEWHIYHIGNTQFCLIALGILCTEQQKQLLRDIRKCMNSECVGWLMPEIFTYTSRCALCSTLKFKRQLYSTHKNYVSYMIRTYFRHKIFNTLRF